MTARDVIAGLVAEWRAPTPQDECTLYTMGVRAGRHACADRLESTLAQPSGEAVAWSVGFGGEVVAVTTTPKDTPEARAAGYTFRPLIYGDTTPPAPLGGLWPTAHEVQFVNGSRRLTYTPENEVSVERVRPLIYGDTTPPAPLGGLTEGEVEIPRYRLYVGERCRMERDSSGDAPWVRYDDHIAALGRLTAPRAEGVDVEDDPAEAAYWRFDARRKGYAEWASAPQSERDAFKAEYRAALARLERCETERDEAAEEYMRRLYEYAKPVAVTDAMVMRAAEAGSFPTNNAYEIGRARRMVEAALTAAAPKVDGECQKCGAPTDPDCGHVGDCKRAAAPQAEAGEERWITQTSFYDAAEPDACTGNCTEAALASLFALPLTSVPSFSGLKAPEYWDAVDQFVGSLGFVMHLKPANYAPEGLYLASGKSDRGCDHMVVMEGGVLKHDPHPSRAGLLSVEHVYLFVPKDPAYMGCAGRTCRRKPFVQGARA